MTYAKRMWLSAIAVLTALLILEWLVRKLVNLA